jgi:hypothetical protein
MKRSALKSPKIKILEVYSKLMNEYFYQLSESKIMKELDYPSDSICIGINVIHRVFELALTKTKNLERTYYYSQKAYLL